MTRHIVPYIPCGKKQLRGSCVAGRFGDATCLGQSHLRDSLAVPAVATVTAVTATIAFAAGDAIATTARGELVVTITQCAHMIPTSPPISGFAPSVPRESLAALFVACHVGILQCGATGLSGRQLPCCL